MRLCGGVVEAPRLRPQQTGIRVRQLPTIGDADIGLGMQVGNDIGEGIGVGRNRILRQIDKCIGLDLLTGPTPCAAMVELVRLDNLDPCTEFKEARHRAITRCAVDHQKLIWLQCLHRDRR